MSEEIQKMFNQVARRYDFLNHFMSFGRDIAWRKKAIKKLFQKMHSTSFLSSPTQKIKVLDLCGGTGDLIKTLEKKYRHVEISVIGDFSFPMLSYSKKKGIVAYSVQCDALHLPFLSESFDVVMCGYGMRNLDDLSIAIPEIGRILKSGGFFLTLEFFRPVKVLPILFYKILAPLFVPILGSLFSKQKHAYEYLIQSICTFSSVEEYEKYFKDLFQHCWNWSCDASISDIVLAQKK